MAGSFTVGATIGKPYTDCNRAILFILIELAEPLRELTDYGSGWPFEGGEGEDEIGAL
jgi:hypothetical protein